MTRGAWPLAVAVFAALTGCPEGYQGGGPALQLHYDMTEDESLAAMNEIARQLNVDDDFVLQASCVLAWGTGPSTQAVSLQGKEASMAKVDDREVFDVMLSDVANPGLSPVTVVLPEVPWAEATQMKWLLDFVRRFC